MHDAPAAPRLHSAMALLKYIHAPAVGFFYLGAYAFSLCVLQKSKEITRKRRSGILALATITLVAYTKGVLYYFSRSIADGNYEPPKPAAIRCLGSILTWTPNIYQIERVGPRIRSQLHPSSCIPTSIVRFLCHSERRPLLGETPADGTAAAATTLDSPDAEIKAKRAKSLEEGGWVGYLKAFSVVLPYLFLRDDSKVMGSLVARLIHVLSKRALNLLAPRQLGIITNKLSEPNPTMPWKDISLWVFYTYINSYAGLGVLDGIAKMVIATSAHRRITLFVYQHVLGLSMEFHTSKDSGEVLKAIEQASLDSLIDMVFFTACPILLDLVVAMYYVTSLFNAYMAFIILFMGAAYISIGWYSTSLSQPKRRDYVKKQRMENCRLLQPFGFRVQGVNMEVQGGRTLAFVGETGGGKSTMLQLLFRFYDVTGGSIMIDGQDLRSVTQSSLREALGVVPQDPVLFNQTIRQNVRYARLQATDAEIEDACRSAAIHDDIENFPDKYESKVGERGVRLSGGQLQRIAIARVLLKNPKIVLLDEATSALDSETEEKIQVAFRKLSKGRTTFVIAHRFSTIVDADQILVVEKGKIIERGTHQYLLLTSGKYSELWSKQTAGHLSEVNSKAPSKANSAKGDDDDGTSLIDITPAEEDSATASGRSDDIGKTLGKRR
ncbi:hypothetical protein HBH98_251560 [Parastagonospora nodorum]|nr:hypothetical protein HBH53_257720 [Parastagonospora nodorum]KAH3956114.1 hypothetical protein HBH51_253980 [Parastagonospora nodorum]KAH4215369.1 hypothetical protein HBI06_254930 [Parastagonospora nodorum]KAH4223054.1 hypothetical protein HBI05_251760 [Parastagonospora nodorum]KAH4332802.1 hypothetical protein HBH98_251560 [Parastagonospora nodorum]